MKNLYLLLLVLIILPSFINAQNASDYFFETKSGVALADMSGGITAIGVGEDDVSTNPINFFDFKFGGITYNQFSISSNGVVVLGTNPYISYYYDDYIAQSNTYPVLLPWGEDLSTANGGITYKITGSSPQRRLIIEYKVNSIEDNKTSFNKTFQVWLFEGTNKIQFVYGSGFASWYNNATIGIASSASDFLSVTGNGHTLSSATVDPNNGTWPGAGRSYIFSPVEITDEPDPVVVSPNPISVSDNCIVSNITCYGQGNGAIKLGTISGGDGNYNVTWTGPNGYTASGTSIYNLNPGSYTYVITDGVQSAPVSGVVNITEPAAMNFSVSMFPEYPVQGQQIHTIYLGYGSQSVKLGVAHAVAGSEYYTYSWFPATGLSDATAAEPTATPTATTTYHVTITNANGCSTTKPVTVNVVDVRFNDEIAICKNGKSEYVNIKNVENRLRKGATLGACPSEIDPIKRTAIAFEASEIFSNITTFKAYPNPTSGLFSLDLGELGSKANVMITDLSGRLLVNKTFDLKEKGQTATFDLRAQPTGIYIIKVSSAGQYRVAKVIKQ